MSVCLRPFPGQLTHFQGAKGMGVNFKGTQRKGKGETAGTGPKLAGRLV